MHIDTIYNVDEKKIEELAKKQELNSEDRAIIEEAAHHCYIPALRIYREYDMDAVVEILKNAVKYDDVDPEILIILAKIYASPKYFNQQESIRLIKLASDKGSIEASFQLGLQYRNGGFGLEKNIQTSFFYLSKAAEKDADAMVSLARLIQNNNLMGAMGGPFIIKLLKKAVSMGNIYAMQNLATYYYKGKYVEQDFYKARLYLLNARELGERDYTYYNLYMIYKAEDSPFKDQAESMNWLMRGIEDGSEKCQRELNRLKEEERNHS